LLTLRDNDLDFLYFAPFGYAGTSGEAMHYVYKVANRRVTPDLGSLMIGISEIQSKLLGVPPESNPAIVFIDDFSGTGDEALELWSGELDEEFPDRARLEEVVPLDATVYLALPVVFDSAIRRIDRETNG